MPSRIFGSLSMHSTSMSASWLTSTRCGSARARVARQRRRERHLDREMRAAAGRRLQLDACDRARARCAPRSRGRGRARARPWRPDRADGIRGRSRASSIAGCRARCRRRRCAAGRRAGGSRPARGLAGVYLIAFETRFCSSRRSSRRSERTARVLGTKVSVEPLLARERREFDLELAHQLVDAEARRSPASSRRNRAARCRAARRGFPRRLRARRRRSRPAARPRRCPAARPGWSRRAARR